LMDELKDFNPGKFTRNSIIVETAKVYLKYSWGLKRQNERCNMTQGNSSTNWFIRIIGASAFAGMIAMLALVSQLVSSRGDEATSKTQEANQAIQIAQQQTQIALADEQNQLQSQQLTLVAQQFNIESRLLTPELPDNNNFSLTATAFSIQATQIELTSQAIATRQRDIETTQTAIAFQPTPSVVIRAEDVIDEIKGVDNGLSNVFSWWREYDFTENNGEYRPAPLTGHKCYGLAWNTEQYGYHRLVVFQNRRSLTFTDDGAYTKVCIPDSVAISVEDIGKIKADWLGKRYGDIKNRPWEVIVNP
jgi:hypothetical protein